jgi:amino acid transporter
VATCPSGDRVVSGGIYMYAGYVAGDFSEASENGSSWIVGVSNESTYASGFVQATAYCAGAGQAVAASRTTLGHTQAVAQSKVLLANMERAMQSEKAKGE